MMLAVAQFQGPTFQFSCYYNLPRGMCCGVPRANHAASCGRVSKPDWNCSYLRLMVAVLKCVIVAHYVGCSPLPFCHKLPSCMCCGLFIANYDGKMWHGIQTRFKLLISWFVGCWLSICFFIYCVNCVFKLSRLLLGWLFLNSLNCHNEWFLEMMALAVIRVCQYILFL